MDDILNTLNQINFTTFDMIIIVVVTLLGLKGFMNGLIKELFAIIGLVGGIYFASRHNEELSQLIQQNLIEVTNEQLLHLVSFIIILAVIWATSSLVGKLFSKLTEESGLGFINRILGFVVGGGKYLIIFALIITAISNIKKFQEKITEQTKDSQVYPVLKDIGEYIIHIENVESVTIKPEQIKQEKGK